MTVSPEMSGRPGGARVDVCLVNMPYASLPRASIALSLLKAILEGEGIRTRVLYPNLWFAERVGISLYHLCSHQSPTEFLAGEWTFAGAAFPDARRRDEEYLRWIARSYRRIYPGGIEQRERLVDDLQRLRSESTAFIAEVARRILATGARIVGCTSTFEQHVASLALLRRIRELDPSVTTMLGGANCEAEMGETTHRYFPWVDYVVSGEADGIIADLCRNVLASGRDVPIDRLPSGVLGPAHRVAAALGEARPTLPRAMFSNLDDLPYPDLDDYFETLRASAVSVAVTPGLPLETSRGCWWGAVHHCTFCGLNGSSMAYRSKSPGRVIEEIRAMETRYGTSKFETVDNILDVSYFKSMLPRLAEDGREREIFYEVKANLSRAQVELMRRAGIRWLQPGIESLHSDVLRLMDKGVHGWQNVQLLKWAREFGIRMSWAVLWGFPGEKDDWYALMARWFPPLEHLQAPSGLTRLRFDRFSVYHTKARQLGLMLHPTSSMRFAYPLADEALANLAYFFRAEGGPDAFGDGPEAGTILNGRPGVAAVLNGVRQWRSQFYRYLRPILSIEDDGETAEVVDTRTCAAEFRVRLRGLERALLLASDRAPVETQLPAIVAEEFAISAGASAIDAALHEIVERRKLMLRIDRRVVALPVHGAIPSLPERSEFPGGYVIDIPLHSEASVMAGESR